MFFNVTRRFSWFEEPVNVRRGQENNFSFKFRFVLRNDFISLILLEFLLLVLYFFYLDDYFQFCVNYYFDLFPFLHESSSVIIVHRLRSRIISFWPSNVVASFIRQKQKVAILENSDLFLFRYPNFIPRHWKWLMLCLPNNNNNHSCDR